LDLVVAKGVDAYLTAWSGLPASIQQRAASRLEAHVEQMAELEPKRVSEWVSQLPASARDAAIRGLVSYLESLAGARDYEAAATWAAAITEPGARDEALRGVYDNWSARVGDGPAAIQASQLPEALKTMLLSYGK
jgi:hypothetical protein